MPTSDPDDEGVDRGELADLGEQPALDPAWLTTGLEHKLVEVMEESMRLTFAARRRRMRRH